MRSLGRAFTLVCVAILAACARDAGRARAPGEVVPAAPAKGATGKGAGARFFHASAQDGFWVSHAADRDLVISAGARLELRPSGEVLAAAWDLELAHRGDPLVGGLAVPERLGGGFVFWSARRLFTATTFTGEIEAIHAYPAESGIRGARAGLKAIFVATQLGPRELLPGSRALTPARDPGLYDAVAISPRRALHLDVFGRALHTADGGVTWVDLSPSTGLGVRQLAASEGEIWLDTWQGRVRITPQGKVESVEGGQRGYDPSRAFQPVWRGTRADQREGVPWGLHNTSALQTAVAAGAPIGDGTAFGVAPNVVARVDLATGELRSISTDWIPNGLSCQPVRAPDAVLFACVWDRSTGYGGYVLRSEGGAPPEVEKVFTDEGSFVADGEGAIAYLGSCRAKAHYHDPDDQSRFDPSQGEPPLSPVICARRGPGAWVERRVEVSAPSALLAWAPRRDGAVAAIVRDGEPLPPPLEAPVLSGESGVTVLRVHGDFQGWTFKRPSWSTDGSGLSGHVDTRFGMREDGGVDGWLSPSQEGSTATSIGISFDPRGGITLHPAAPDMAATVTGGRFALSFSREGDLFESEDHGRTWRSAGKATAPPPSWGALTCSSLGCSLGPLLRLGWGEAAITPRVSTAAFADPDIESLRASLPRLSCAPRGAPAPVIPPPRAAAGEKSGARQAISTTWGDTLEIVRDASVPEPPPPGAPAPPSAPPPPATPAPAKKKAPARATPAVLRTHTLHLRPLFSPQGAHRQLNATDASFNPQRRSGVVPLLAPSGEVDLLVSGDQREMLIVGDRITTFPAPEPRRWFEPGTGLLLPHGRALVLSDSRRRLAIEEHGPGAAQPTVYLGIERSGDRRRPLSLGRREDGTVGILVLDGGGPESVGVAIVDKVSASAGLVTRLAPWSKVVSGEDPRCKKGADPGAFSALLVVDPAAWLALDDVALPGVTMGSSGLALVRWGKERVCLEGIDFEARERRRRGESRPFRLVARWGAQREGGAALRALDLQQELVCRIEAPAKRP